MGFMFNNKWRIINFGCVIFFDWPQNSSSVGGKEMNNQF